MTKRSSFEEFVQKCNQTHHNQYDYSKVIYTSVNNKVTVICKTHGPFSVMAMNHQRGSGCPLCANNIRNTNNIKTQEQFLMELEERNIQYPKSKVYLAPGEIYITAKTKLTFICDKQHTWSSLQGDILRGHGCPECAKNFMKHDIPHKKFENSQIERDVLEKITSFIDSNDIIVNDRNVISPLELDFYIPKHNLGIEINGIQWHSELFGGKNNKYHLLKMDLCKEKGIQLLQFWDFEWNIKQNLIISKIKILTGNSNKIAARQCNVQLISKIDARAFLNTYHIQGHHNSQINIGLLFKDELVSVMSFSKSRFNKNIQYELTRLCSKPETTIVGGVSKLFSFFVKRYEPSSIISYCDLRYGQGQFYKTLGFTYSHRAKPNYFYFQPNIDSLYSRQKFQKHKLEKQLTVFDEELTEWQNMQLNGYDRVWDCGNDVWVWNQTSL